MGDMALSRLALYSPRPSVHVDGADNRQLAGALLSMAMREQEGGMSSLEMAIGAHGPRDDGSVGLLYEDERLIKLGTRLTLLFGDTAIFEGMVSAIELAIDSEGPPRLLLQAEDAAQRARLRRRSIVHEQLSLAEIARRLAADLGLSPVISGFDQSRELEVQFNESDLAFLRRLLAREGGDMQVSGRELQVAPRGQLPRHAISLQMHSQLRKLSAVADLADQVSELRVTGFDFAAGQTLAASGSAATLGPGRGRTGAQLLQQVFGAREQLSSHRLALSQAEAQALARAEFEQRARRFVRVDGICEGNPALRVGSRLSLIDVSPRFDNDYEISACTHRFDTRRGYETEFRAEGAYLGEPA